MDPKVCGKLLTHHRRGYGVDVEALRDRFPLWWSAGKAPRWDLMGTEGCGGGIRFLAPYLEVWGYVGIYRRKKYVGGATRGPRGWRARPLASWLPPLFLDAHSKSHGSRLLRKSRSRRFHSVWTPFDIPFLRNTKIGKNSNTGWASG